MVHTSTMRRMWLCALGAVALAGLTWAPAPAMAQSVEDGEVNPVVLTRHCKEAMARITRHSVERINEVKMRTLGALRQAAEEGAPNGVLFEIGEAGKGRIDEVTRAHIQMVNGVAQKCVRTLNELGEFPQLVEEIAKSRRRAIGTLLHARELACRRIVNAVRDATGIALSVSSLDENGEAIDESGEDASEAPLNEATLSL